MAKSTHGLPGKGEGPPDPTDHRAFEKWLGNQPRQWSVTIAARASLRVVPLVSDRHDLPGALLPMLRATAIARFAAKHPSRKIERVSYVARSAYAARSASTARSHYAARSFNAAESAAPAAASYAASAAAAYAASAAGAAADTTAAAAAAFTTAAAIAYAAVKHDAQRLHGEVLTPEQLARDQLWPVRAPDKVVEAWRQLVVELDAWGDHWHAWIDWYNHVVHGELHRQISEAEDAAYTDIPGTLRWDDGAEVVNKVIVRRLAELPRVAESQIPDQSPAPVRVEERDGRVSRATDRDSALNSSELDFRAWRDPVVEHIGELATSDFAVGTNHSRIRDRLMAFGKLLPGEIADVKDRQFRIGYEIERFEGLMAAYRFGGKDMPALNAAQLEDLDRLRVALKMGIDKLERWSEFRKQANESMSGEADADREIVGDALDEMAAVMEQHPKYFDPELPATFRFLSEAVRDPLGATKTVVYGAIKSAQNLVSFLGQRALGIGKKGAEAVEAHVSKAVAASLIAGLGTAALRVSGALPEGWAWLKPLLAALGVGG
jgi:hypothetical protein